MGSTEKKRASHRLISRLDELSGALSREAPELPQPKWKKLISDGVRMPEADFQKKIQHGLKNVFTHLSPRETSEGTWQAVRGLLEQAGKIDEGMKKEYQAILDKQESQEKEKEAIKAFLLNEDRIAFFVKNLIAAANKGALSKNASQKREDAFSKQVGGTLSKLAEIGANQLDYSSEGRIIKFIITSLFALCERIALEINDLEPSPEKEGEQTKKQKDNDSDPRHHVPNANPLKINPYTLFG